MDGPLTGEWFARRVRGKWSRTEYWLVGPQVNKYQYVAYRDGNRAYGSRLNRFGNIFIEHALLSAKGQKMVKHGVRWVVVCDECETDPQFDPYSGKFVCSCGKQSVTERKGKWYTCAECSRRFKSMEPEFLCPECLSRDT